MAASALRSVVEGSLARWQALGLEVVETEFVADDAAPSPEGVARFAAAGVDAVLFAVPAATARQWALQHSVLDPSVRYVIGDTFDAVWAERHPPVFDGALTSTSLVVPWLAREQGETGVQAACREEWEAQVQPPVLLEGEETVRVFSWCLHVGLVESLGAVADPAAALRRLAGPSPLTSDLGPRPGRPWGPRTAALLVWRAACGCWESSETP